MANTCPTWFLCTNDYIVISVINNFSIPVFQLEEKGLIAQIPNFPVATPSILEERDGNLLRYWEGLPLSLDGFGWTVTKKRSNVFIDKDFGVVVRA